MTKEQVLQYDQNNSNFGELDSEIIPTSESEMEYEKEVEQLINSEIQDSGELAREAVVMADEIINNKFSTEEEIEIAQQSKNKIVSLGFYLKNGLNNLIRLGIIGGALFMGPMSASGKLDDENSMPKNAPLKEHICISGPNSDVNPNYQEEKFYLNISAPACWDETKLKKIRSLGDEQRNKLLEIISKEEYFNKLIKEYGSVEEAKKELNYRKYLVNNSDFTLKEFIVTPDLTNVNGVFIRNLEKKCFGIYIADDKAVPEEYVHLFSGGRIPKNTESILQKSFFYNNDLDSKYSKNFSLKNLKEYFGNTNERYAKLHVLKLRLEESGIKKYEETFTKEHYDKLVELVKNFNKGEQVQLDIDSIIVLETTKGFGSDEGFKWLKIIFDEIAMNGSDINNDSTNESQINKNIT
ncbi:MAG: hypothetical protein PHZ07_01770 [Patescibacteria group bacterium]|nr:hypothetical protein [Patescibacteria group bacterium]MDD4304086.1 hypothetical protein [Patescibacteria group bacterium]MDD4694963.1 hypothetical protein [Patescibacteria group bacterium]